MILIPQMFRRLSRASRPPVAAGIFHIGKNAYRKKEVVGRRTNFFNVILKKRFSRIFGMNVINPMYEKALTFTKITFNDHYELVMWWGLLQEAFFGANT